MKTKTFAFTCIIHLILFIYATPGVATDNQINRKSLTILGITPGVSKFNDVYNSFGEATRQSLGDAATSRTEICYRIHDGLHEAILIFSSNNEMAGSPEFIVTDITVYSREYNIKPDYTELPFIEPYDNPNICSLVKSNSLKIRTSNGIKLGMKQKQIYSILGKPVDKNNNSAGYSSCIEQLMNPTGKDYDYWSKRRGCFEDNKGGWNGKPHYDICTGINILFENGIAVYFIISSGTSVC